MIFYLTSVVVCLYLNFVLFRENQYLSTLAETYDTIFNIDNFIGRFLVYCACFVMVLNIILTFIHFIFYLINYSQIKGKIPKDRKENKLFAFIKKITENFEKFLNKYI